MHKLEELKSNKDIWRSLEVIPVSCSWCGSPFDIKYGTLYNIIRRDAEGVYCSRSCSGSSRSSYTQRKYQDDGGKQCKRCGEFKKLENFSRLPNPPYFRSECKRCHNYKPARIFSFYKEKAIRSGVIFEITLDEFLDFWKKDCFYCSSEIKKIRIDLLDKKNGYIKNNIISCCIQCQNFKSDLTHEEFVSMCNKISRNFKVEE